MERFYVTLLLITILMGVAVLLIMIWGDTNDITGFADEAVVSKLKQNAPHGSYYICKTKQDTVYFSKESKPDCVSA